MEIDKSLKRREKKQKTKTKKQKQQEEQEKKRNTTTKKREQEETQEPQFLYIQTPDKPSKRPDVKVAHRNIRNGQQICQIST